MPSEHHPVRIRDCVNFSFISSYSIRPPAEDTTLAARLRHYAVISTLALFTVCAIASSYCLATINDAGVGLHIGGPVANILFTWLMAWGLIVLRNAQGSREMLIFRIAFLERSSYQLKLSMGRKILDIIIYTLLLLTALLFVGLCLRGANEGFAKMFPLIASCQMVILVGGVVLSAAAALRSLDEQHLVGGSPHL